MERMKIEIEKSEYDRLKSREEKLLAYYGWFVDKENDLATVEDIINENIELRNTIEDIYKENRKLLGDKVRLKTLSNHKTDVVMGLGKNLDELKEENKKLKKYNGELIENHKKDIDVLCEENKKLNERIKELEQCNLNLQTWLDNKEKVNKSLREELSAYDREYFDEDKKAKNIFIDKSGKVIKGGEFTTLC